ncbi:hypothetical protein QCA50_017809 [Cerrena zonata]|uniref:Uncharacterized protein n=1 Tax=Cerrena zonata TaxID=2478898 RepID=A0AAW0FPG7_9APHY
MSSQRITTISLDATDSSLSELQCNLPTRMVRIARKTLAPPRSVSHISEDGDVHKVKPSNNVLYIPDPNLRCSMDVNIGSSIFYTRATITIPEFHLISPAKEHYELLGEEKVRMCYTLHRQMAPVDHSPSAQIRFQDQSYTMDRVLLLADD